MAVYSIDSDGICPHCGRSVRFIRAEQRMVDSTTWSGSYFHILASGNEESVFAYSSLCPSCKKPIVALQYGKIGKGQYSSPRLAYPIHIERFVPPEVPEKISEDFREATAVLPRSEKASAALSRRCLQNILMDQGAPPKQNLSKQIDWVLPKLPTHIAENVDAIRNVGNFAAHPIKDTYSGAIVEVEAGEAEWNLDVLEDLFDFYYVQPEKAKAKRKKLDEKLKVAKKPPMKKP